MHSRTGVENLRTESGELTSKDGEKAEVLNTFFCSVCTIEDPCHVSSTDSVNTYVGPILTDEDLSVDLVKSKVSNLRKSAAPGPDGIYPRVLCETARTISPILTEIFKKSLDSGTVLWDWTLADVVPIYKKGG